MIDAAPQELLDRAIARNSAIVLSLPSAGMLRHHKSRFLGETEDGIAVDFTGTDTLLVDELLSSQKPCAVAFRVGVDKIGFIALIVRIQNEWIINADTPPVPALVLKHPDQVKVIQRRSAYRVSLSAESGVSLRVWRMGPKAKLRDQPMASAELKLTLRDISVGGIGVTFLGKDGQPPRVSPEDRLRVMLTFEDQSMLLEGNMRANGGRPKPDLLVTGIGWVDCDDDIKTRRDVAQLARLVGALQREEVRRTRLGLTPAA